MDPNHQVDTVLEAVPPPEHIDPNEPPQVVLHPHADPRNLALGVLATIAVLAVLRWGSAFFIPLMLGFVFYYALAPVVEALARARIPRALGAGVLILAILSGGGSVLWSLADDANELIESLPAAAERVRAKVQQRTATPDPARPGAEGSGRTREGGGGGRRQHAPGGTRAQGACSGSSWRSPASTSASTCGAGPWGW